ncbi:hypothetical protein CSOJ01_03293 [Colletotrichum sojae]|uniref:Uncharacterized protein n=1 Tax=Colletotrichum sojae TaxID=2175907 RepID=A0A8H6JM80_9PEZI|nr:hypothetical protein CSOJ01_03293 [Colletotrichum sojae]
MMRVGGRRKERKRRSEEFDGGGELGGLESDRRGRRHPVQLISPCAEPPGRAEKQSVRVGGITSTSFSNVASGQLVSTGAGGAVLDLHVHASSMMWSSQPMVSPIDAWGAPNWRRGQVGYVPRFPGPGDRGDYATRTERASRDEAATPFIRIAE